MHAAIELNGGGVVMLNDDFPEFQGGTKSTPEAFGGTPCTLHLEQPKAADVDALYERALKAGAKSLMAPEDMFWGDRYAQVADPFGHLVDRRPFKKQLDRLERGNWRGSAKSRRRKRRGSSVPALTTTSSGNRSAPIRSSGARSEDRRCSAIR